MWYAPILAKKKRFPDAVVVDFDGTIAEEVKYPAIGKACPGVRKALQKLMDAGFEVIIYTCRLRKDSGRTMGDIDEMRDRIEEWLKKNGIPYTKIDDGHRGKPHGVAMIDNKGVPYTGSRGNWGRIADDIIKGILP